jgi:pimeloyl-ACP methyl ester carboxylesterase
VGTTLPPSPFLMSRPTPRLRRSWSLALSLVLLVGCATVPVSVERVDPRTVHRNLTANALTVGEPSLATRNVLFERNLEKTYDAKPEEALSQLHQWAVKENDSDAFFALTELAFLQGEHSADQTWHLATALYAWAFLFGGQQTRELDPRVRVAADLYNRGLTEGLTTKEGIVELRGGLFKLPFGQLAVDFDEGSLDWNGRRLRNFVPVAEFEVHGLHRFRNWGIGAPLAADARAANPDVATDFIAPRLKVPATALLRPDDVRKEIALGHVHARLELYVDPDVNSIEIAGRSVPLEQEETATWAAMLADSPLWKMELKAFLGAVGGGVQTGRLVGLRPHVKGRVPVVFVHGTYSNPGRWAEMVNVLDHDPRIRERFEPWFFFYNSGSPIIYSSYLLRKSLGEAVTQLDPSGTDACLRDMVVIGHSQGGLLTKMTAVDSGDRFWQGVSKRRFDRLKISRADRELLQEVVFVKPLPFVKRLVFIATPHRGSFLASRGLVRRLMLYLVSLPRRVTGVTTRLLASNPDAFLTTDFGRMTAVDNMAPGQRFLRTLSALPIAPGVTVHSIIAVKGDGPVEGGNDGVVEYSSAHIDGVESEKVVRSAHSVQANPEAIEEVRRILLLHASVGCAEGPAPPSYGRSARLFPASPMTRRDAEWMAR